MCQKHAIPAEYEDMCENISIFQKHAENAKYAQNRIYILYNMQHNKNKMATKKAYAKDICEKGLRDSERAREKDILKGPEGS